ncbi:acetyl-CoA carboxylase biotin carboxyl carrier protein [Psychrobacter sp. YP14]|jgi:acetyl-CoA carboxylase biotin carboxyl carrier protein|uniref:Biotin carboxyl carrier protein of acetyl-CoA carboxylase n=3 Tax=Psychrobacter TaxID=497 RepID=A0A844M0H5_9GAMM|nr:MULTISPECIES: acetyl-CoA carboxylase biotin carboxyl carrier protein [Psychrobacter]AWT49400.1 acetyl-CoA carboxylase biotin carboxyl carrier protein [Psychrobacter sp. YP14]MUG32190.1 acetyl-CoA carboxylase biotin carboxyl carrier protein [Psychrobacter sanguinis]UNK04778.1 acetyl-CoA carboxylase biotin carboxyl carrier protein [Psychrobacter sp. PraFG1]
MEIQKIRTLIELMEEKDLVNLEIKTGDDSVSLTRHYNTPMPSMMAASPTFMPESQPEVVHSGSIETSPMVGVFYAAPSPNDPPFVTPGQKVQAGDTLGIIEAMKIMNPLEATQSGIVDAILVENGDVVQFGQPVIRYRN